MSSPFSATTLAQPARPCVIISSDVRLLGAA